MALFERKKLRLLLVPLLAGAVAVLSGCGERNADNTRAAQAARDKILLLGNGAEPKNLDPHTVTGVTENKIISALIEGLVSYHPTDDHIPEPGVAESWESNEDASVWTFSLRRDAKWSNGDPVTAADFLFSYERMLSPVLGAEYGDMLYLLKNGEAFHKGEITDFSEVGVKAPDDDTLELTLVGPTPFFLSMLNHYAWFPVHEETILRFGSMTDRDTPWTRAGNFVGNGPFQLKEWRTNEIIRVERNPHYWDAETVRLNGIHFYPIEDINTEERAFRAGQLHYTNTVPLDRIPAYQRDHPDRIRFDPYLGTYFYRFNVTRPPLDDPRVRKALALTIDRESLIRNVIRGGQRPAYGFTPDGTEGYETPQPLEYNPEKARELLAEAGFPNGDGFPSFDLLINTSESHRAIAEAIQQMWKQHLSIDIGLSNQEWRVYLDSQTNLRYDIARAGWIGDYMDPVTFLNMWTTGNGNNNTGWSNEAFDSLIAGAGQTGEQAERYRLLREAEEIFLEELPVAPIYWYTSIYLLDPRVKNWEPKLLDNRNYKYIDIEADEADVVDVADVP